MNENEKAEMIAMAENIEAIRDFFNQWWTVEQLYEVTAKACTTIMFLESKVKISDDERKDLRDLMEQHMMLIETMKPFARKEGDNYGK